ncbi:tRNA adenosine(34) deaminase TadA [Candidatus Erwinia haradaeae]|uniref:tRNA-specific adenosine deaminase n=1 Tax=Candidatus Erwinia haradaeae TaxID=1922217 RepID=A0A451D1H5_9GAMM|nr:tRNA adenosine(34) deaminase TadA [Candidatus Erwinia haradaeae]VFP79464.1 tRNA-specific adenosine deaminase [Candidatus Erwinia haradaeae]
MNTSLESFETTQNHDEHWMRHAISLANNAQNQGEVPIGAIVVLHNKVIGEGWNQPITLNDPTAHAEIIALRQAAQTLRNYRLIHSTLYVTLEPCSMCAGAILYSRIYRLVYGARSSKNSSITSCIDTLGYKGTNHHVHIKYGILDKECSNILRKFFYKKRIKKY